MKFPQFGVRGVWICLLLFGAAFGSTLYAKPHQAHSDETTFSGKWKGPVLSNSDTTDSVVRGLLSIEIKKQRVLSILKFDNGQKHIFKGSVERLRVHEKRFLAIGFAYTAASKASGGLRFSINGKKTGRRWHEKVLGNFEIEMLQPMHRKAQIALARQSKKYPGTSKGRMAILPEAVPTPPLQL